MRIRMLTSVAGADVSWNYGDLVEVREDVGRAWVKEGIASRVSQDEATADDVDRLTDRNAELERDAADLAARERAAVALAEERRAKLAEVEAAAGDAPKLAREIASLRDRLAKAETQYAEQLAANGSVAREREAREAAEARVKELVAEVARLESRDVDALESEIKTLREKVADQASKIAELEDGARTDQSLIASLTSQVDANTQALKGAQS